MKRKYRISILTSLIIFFIITVLVISFLTHIQKLVNENTLRNLGETTKQDVEKIENKIQEHIRILETILNEIEEKQPINEEEVFNIYNRNSGKDEFSRIAILYKNGKTITSDGGIIDLSEDKEYFFSNNQIQISKQRQSKVNNQKINIYSKKTRINKDDVVILLAIETSKYNEMFTQKIYNGTALEYIITEEGNVVANSKNGDEEINIFEELKKNNKNEIDKIEKMKRQILNNVRGQIIYSINTLNYYIAFEKLNVEKWTLVVITPGDIIAEELNKLVKVIVIVSAIIAVIIFGIALYILITNTKKKEILYRLAYIDNVTGLGNYNYYKKVIKEELQKNIKKTIIILDINKFKSFNKKYGHSKGNDLLKALGEGIKKNIRKSDIVCRLANDNFGIFIAEEIDPGTLSKRLNKTLSKIVINNITYNINLSIGVYIGDENEKDAEELIDKAIIAHDKIKGSYNKEYCLFDEKLEEELLRENEIESIMGEAIEEQEFEIFYQPKVLADNEKIKGAEALVRWNRNGKYISPRKVYSCV